MSSVQQRITQLRNNNLARKTSRPVAGSMVRFTTKTSQTFQATIPSANNAIIRRVKFTAATPNANGKTLVELEPAVSIQSDFSVIYPRVLSVNEPQSGDGSVVCRFEISGAVGSTFYYRVVSRGASDGTFSVL
jgi:hypothetical protein